MPSFLNLLRWRKLNVYEVINVKTDYGAKGDGTTDDSASIQAALDAAFGSTGSPHADPSKYTNRIVYFPSGNYRIVTGLNITYVTGGRIIGSGMTSTRLFYAGAVDGVAITSLFKTNGCAYTHFEGLSFEISGTETVAFNLDWDGVPNTVALNANQFVDCAFSSATVGMLIGVTGYMGSENVFLNCYFNNCTTAGCKVANYNALQQTIIGGGADGNAVAFLGQTGSFQLIESVGFGINNTLAIKQISGDACSIIGCRSEGTNFLQADGTIQVSGCTHQAAANGHFIEFAGDITAAVTVDACNSTLGDITGGGTETKLSVRSSNFSRADYLDTYTGVALLEAVGRRGNTALSSVDGFKHYRGGVVRTHEIEATALSSQSFLYENTTGQTVTVTIASPGVFTLASHGLSVGSPIAFTTSGALPTGLSVATTYYVKTVPTSNTFTVSASSGGTVINTSGSQSGAHTVSFVRTYVIGDIVLKSNVAAGGSPGWICTTAGPSITNGAASVAVFKALANVAA